MTLYTSPPWGLRHDITPCFGARLVQEGNRLHYLGDRAGLYGTFSAMQLRALDRSFPAFIRRMESALRSGELDPHKAQTGKGRSDLRGRHAGKLWLCLRFCLSGSTASIKEADMLVPIEHLNGLWRELKNIAVIEEEGTLVIRDAFIHFPAGTPVLDIWVWFEDSNSAFVVARMLYG